MKVKKCIYLGERFMESFETNKDQFLTWKEFLRVVTAGIREKAKKTNRTNDVYTDPSAW